jgi:hypothetical protein
MMEDNLGKLVEYSIPGDEQYLVISDSKSRMYTRYDPPMEFLASNAGYEMALYRLETYFSFPNINSSNNCIRISIDSGKNWLDLKIPIGSYNIDGINEALQRLLPEKSNDANIKKTYVVLSGNKCTLKCELEIMKDSTIVDFDVENSVQSVLGFEKKKYKGGKRYESENKVNILNVDPILLHCDVIKPSRVNGVLKPIIYIFFPNVSPGEKIVNEPQHLIYVPLTMDIISSMTVWVTDQDQNLLDLRGQQLTLTFHIRKRR